MIGDELLRYFMISNATTRRWRERNRQGKQKADIRKARHTDSQTAGQTDRQDENIPSYVVVDMFWVIKHSGLEIIYTQCHAGCDC